VRLTASHSHIFTYIWSEGKSKHSFSELYVWVCVFSLREGAIQILHWKKKIWQIIILKLGNKNSILRQSKARVRAPCQNKLHIWCIHKTHAQPYTLKPQTHKYTFWHARVQFVRRARKNCTYDYKNTCSTAHFRKFYVHYTLCNSTNTLCIFWFVKRATVTQILWQSRATTCTATHIRAKKYTEIRTLIVESSSSCAVLKQLTHSTNAWVSCIHVFMYSCTVPKQLTHSTLTHSTLWHINSMT